MTGFRRRTQFSMPTVLVKCGDFDPIPLCSAHAWPGRCGMGASAPYIYNSIHQLPSDCNDVFSPVGTFAFAVQRDKQPKCLDGIGA